MHPVAGLSSNQNTAQSAHQSHTCFLETQAVSYIMPYRQSFGCDRLLCAAIAAQHQVDHSMLCMTAYTAPSQAMLYTAADLCCLQCCTAFLCRQQALVLR
jgi:hypothetical protein